MVFQIYGKWNVHLLGGVQTNQWLERCSSFVRIYLRKLIIQQIDFLIHSNLLSETKMESNPVKIHFITFVIEINQ
jgi:hypothetical protein